LVAARTPRGAAAATIGTTTRCGRARPCPGARQTTIYACNFPAQRASKESAPDQGLDRRENPMKPRKLASLLAIVVLFAGVLPATSGCAALTSQLTNQPQRMLTPDQLPQIYRNY